MLCTFLIKFILVDIVIYFSKIDLNGYVRGPLIVVHTPRSNVQQTGDREDRREGNRKDRKTETTCATAAYDQRLKDGRGKKKG